MSKSKYKTGRLIESIADFSTCQNTLFKWNNRTKHRAFLISLQYRVLENIIKNGNLYTAELKGDKDG